MAEENKTTPAEKSAPVYEECTEVVGLRRTSGTFHDNEKDIDVEYTSYYLTLGKNVRIKISLDSEKKSLLNEYVPFVPVVEELGVE